MVLKIKKLIRDQQKLILIDLPTKTYSFRGKRSSFARSGTDFVAGAALSQGTVQISR